MLDRRTKVPCWHFWSWKAILNTGFTVYVQCERCGKRGYNQGWGGYQPIDTHWVETGEWLEMNPPRKEG